METFKLVALFVVCTFVGALAGYLAGFILWKLGFVLIGSAVALVGAGIGGIVVFLGVLGWYDRRDRPRRVAR